MAPIYISADNTSAKKTMETIVSDNLTVESNRPIVIVGRTSHFYISFKKGEVTLYIFDKAGHNPADRSTKSEWKYDDRFWLIH